MGSICLEGTCPEINMAYTEGTCKYCAGNCKTCSLNLNDCLSCFEFEYLQGSTCIKDCPSEKYADDSTLTCKACHSSCYECDNPFTCLSCPSNKSLMINTCMDFCGSGAYFEFSNESC